MIIREIPIQDIKPAAYNPRKNLKPGDVEYEKLRTVIDRFDLLQPLVWNLRTGNLVSGHQRLKILKTRGDATVQAVVVDLEVTDEKVLNIALNKVQGDWDLPKLSDLLTDLRDLGASVEDTGFEAAEISDLIGAGDDASAATGDDPGDDIPEAPREPISRPGDLWRAGNHLLLCGDSAKPCDVEIVLAGQKASLCFTSPPYGHQRDYATGGIPDWDALMQRVFSNLPMRPNGQVLVNLGLIHRDNEWQPYWQPWLDWMRSSGWRRFGLYVWDQGPGLPGDWAGRLAPAFEFIFHFNRVSRKPNKIVPCSTAGMVQHENDAGGLRAKNGKVGGWTHHGNPTQDFRIPDNVIRIMRHKGAVGQDLNHPAPFPVKLAELIFQSFSGEHEIVYEPFSGSGSSLIAGERTGRAVRAIELAPAYVDVACLRWLQVFPNISPVLEATGQSFEQVAADRRKDNVHA